MSVFANKAVKEVKNVAPSEKQEDYYKGFRSAVVLVWIFSNLALSALVLSTGGLQRVTLDTATAENTRNQIYMAVVLWSVAGLSFFRFLGAMWFLVVRLVSRLVVFCFDARADIICTDFYGAIVPWCLDIVIMFGYVLGSAFVQDTLYRMCETAWCSFGLHLHLDGWRHGRKFSFHL